MRAIPPDLAAALAEGATTLCRCWKAIRRDGAAFGFTDHDRDLVFAGTAFKAAAGLEASEAESLLGLAVGGGEVAGALSDAAIREEDIAAGLWDGASVETWLVDWSAPTRRMLLDAGSIGEIRRQGEAFTAEVRSLAHLLDQQRGRRYEALCSATLGDARCGVDLAAPDKRVSTAVAAVADPTTFTVALPAGFAPGAFTGGMAVFAGGANVGLQAPILGHGRSGAFDTVTLWAPPRAPLSAGDGVALSVGCDKRFATCRDRFLNAPNFRGFPHIPGNDFVMTYVRQGEAGLDGGPITP